ncbi:glycerol-3-phosphate responsive antiterminator [Ohessyouella blattaphilus]|uniref:Glycerol-3-phosphate responsive antiterminator n=1 Tax=Ohessyouella blattaphilus TaxID=2949333 RepID=A0ABT1EGG8_9FIRM|nr:glycerol-3-phosphate responsive antiterminator [Ohessyouella blattaphilus]MCP1109788.1 glycerol-3-phosphate responsive antiterminator [Ohessyouella blattaphilus]MCR8563182.1 glycerol-3-phosphate responsive antiterminator [Ohessyouella blattaphilus]
MENALQFFLDSTEGAPIIAGIKNDEWLEACKHTSCDIVYILYGDICNIAEIVDEVKAAGKMAVVHVDLITGLSTRDISVDFIKKYTQADGIISTKPFLIKRANELGLFTVQRFFMIDAITYANIKKHVKENNPDVVEIMPAGLTKMIRYVLEQVDKPLVASGLVLDREDVMGALKAGAIAVSTTNMEVWKLNE